MFLKFKQIFSLSIISLAFLVSCSETSSDSPSSSSSGPKMLPPPPPPSKCSDFNADESQCLANNCIFYPGGTENLSSRCVETDKVGLKSILAQSQITVSAQNRVITLLKEKAFAGLEEWQVLMQILQKPELANNQKIASLVDDLQLAVLKKVSEMADWKNKKQGTLGQKSQGYVKDVDELLAEIPTKTSFDDSYITNARNLSPFTKEAINAVLLISKQKSDPKSVPKLSSVIEQSGETGLEQVIKSSQTSEEEKKKAKDILEEKEKVEKANLETLTRVVIKANLSSEENQLLKSAWQEKLTQLDQLQKVESKNIDSSEKLEEVLSQVEEYSKENISELKKIKKFNDDLKQKSKVELESILKNEYLPKFVKQNIDSRLVELAKEALEKSKNEILSKLNDFTKPPKAGSSAVSIDDVEVYISTQLDAVGKEGLKETLSGFIKGQTSIDNNILQANLLFATAMAKLAFEKNIPLDNLLSFETLKLVLEKFNQWTGRFGSPPQNKLKNLLSALKEVPDEDDMLTKLLPVLNSVAPENFRKAAKDKLLELYEAKEQEIKNGLDINPRTPAKGSSKGKTKGKKR